MSDPAKQPGIIVDSIALRTLHFVHSGEGAPAEGAVAHHEIMLSVEPGTDAGVFRIAAGLRTPKEHPGPYRFEIVMEAVIREDATAPNMSADEYARNFGWALLFPFIRERLVDVTARARHGVYVLPPLNVMALVQAQTATHADESTAD